MLMGVRQRVLGIPEETKSWALCYNGPEGEFLPWVGGSVKAAQAFRRL